MRYYYKDANGNKYSLKSVRKDLTPITEEEFNYVEPTPVNPNQALIEQLAQAKKELKSLDYIGVKIATGRATIEEYKDKIDRMNELSNIINNLENQLKGAN